MPPDRIMFIRHAEKPDEGKDGVAADGSLDAESLTVRGWQRAGALIAFFCAQPKMRPDAIFASGIGHGARANGRRKPSRRLRPSSMRTDRSHSSQTLEGRHPALDGPGFVPGGHGPGVLGAQAHSRIGRPPPGAPPVPKIWPDNRFDLVWIFDRAGAGWSFSQVLQRLLPEDGDEPIS